MASKEESRKRGGSFPGDQFGRDRINSAGREKRKGENIGKEKWRKKGE